MVLTDPNTALLVDIDAAVRTSDKRQYPNLALMHISAWKKAQGYEVGWHIQDPAEVWASVVFDWNKHLADGLKWYYPKAKIDVGGGGADLYKNLPPEVDLLKPDYTIYPYCDYDLGFTSRGCIRRCPFCVVPKKEGTFRRHQHPREFHQEGHKKAVLMDNNILADRAWFFEVTDYYISRGMKVDFNQGLDMRLIDEEIAQRIAELPLFRPARFAFDNIAYEPQFMRAAKLLQDAGLDMRHKAEIYVYLDSADEIPSALYRARRIKEAKAGVPYIMVNRHAERTQEITDLCRWCRPQIFFTCDFDDYRRSVRLKNHSTVYKEGDGDP